MEVDKNDAYEMSSVGLSLLSDQPGETTGSTNFLNNFPITVVNWIIHDLIKYIHKHWKIRKVPPDPRKVIRRTSLIIYRTCSEDRLTKTRERKFQEAECKGLFSVNWEPYGEIGGVEMDVTRLVLNNLVPNMEMKEEEAQRSTADSLFDEKPKRKGVYVPNVIYDYPSDINKLLGYDYIKESYELVRDLCSELRKPSANFQSALTPLYEKREEKRRKSHKPGEMILIPLKASDEAATSEKAREILEKIIARYTKKLNSIDEILKILLNMSDEEIRSKLPIARLAMERFKYTKDVGIPTASETYQLNPPECAKGTRRKPHVADDVLFELGRPEPVWQNYHKMTGKDQSAKEYVCPYKLVNHLRTLLIKALEKIRGRQLHQLEQLERNLMRRYKYTFLALSVLPLTLVEFNQVYEYAEYFRHIANKAAVYRKEFGVKTEETKDDREYSLYLLEELEDTFKDMLVERQKLEKPYIEPSPMAVWYQILDEEAVELGISNEEVVKQSLKRLYRYHTVDFDRVTNLNEKFCVTTMSLPAEEVCEPIWQTAAKFVHEEMLEGDQGLVEYWISLRGLPLTMRH